MKSLLKIYEAQIGLKLSKIIPIPGMIISLGAFDDYVIVQVYENYMITVTLTTNFGGWDRKSSYEMYTYKGYTNITKEMIEAAEKQSDILMNVSI